MFNDEPQVITSTCPRCGQYGFKEYDLKYFYQKHCSNCYLMKFEWHECCRNPDIERVLYTQRDGRMIIREQCMNCGKLLGTPAISFSKVDSNSLRFFNESLAEEREKAISLFKEEAKRWPPTYDRYLFSQAWLNKREKILKRDNYLCQKCKKEKAERVHHLTYERIGKELPEDLLSVCVKCHNEIHREERERFLTLPIKM